MIDVRGRPRRSWNVKIIAGEGCLLLRLDDDDDMVYWEELRIPEAELLRLTALVHQRTHAPAFLESPELSELPDGLPPLENLVPLPTR